MAETIESRVSDPLPTECKDLAFARNLIKQMKDGTGRHNSTVSPSRVTGSIASDAVATQNPRPPMRYLNDLMADIRRNMEEAAGISPEYFSGDIRRHSTAAELRAVQRAQFTPYPDSPPPFDLRWNGNFWDQAIPGTDRSVIGIWRNQFIRRSASDCEIGDAFPYAGESSSYFHDQFHQVIKRNSDDPFDLDRLIFTKISVAVTSDNGQTWRYEYFWERVE